MCNIGDIQEKLNDNSLNLTKIQRKIALDQQKFYDATDDGDTEQAEKHRVELHEHIDMMLDMSADGCRLNKELAEAIKRANRGSEDA